MENELTKEEIKKRLTRLNNLEMMYANQVKVNKKLKIENHKLKGRIVELETENQELRKRVEKLELIVEEFTRMIFKRKKKESEKN